MRHDPRVAVRLDRALRVAAMLALPGVGFAAWLTRSDGPTAQAAPRSEPLTERAAAPAAPAAAPAAPSTPDTVSGAGEPTEAAGPAASPRISPSPHSLPSDPLAGPPANPRPRRKRVTRVREAVDLPLREPPALALPDPSPRSAPPRPPSGRVELELVNDTPRWLVPDDLAQAIRRRSATELGLSRATLTGIAASARDLFAGTELTQLDDALAVERVPSGSLAELAGLEAGDRLLEWDGQPLASLEDLRNAWAALVRRAKALAPGARLVARVRVERGGQRFDVEISVE